jgi:hypothetical protein
VSGITWMTNAAMPVDDLTMLRRVLIAVSVKKMRKIEIRLIRANPAMIFYYNMI